LNNTCSPKGFHLPVDEEFEGKSRDTSLQTLPEPQEKALWGESLLSKGYCVDTVSLNPGTIRNYVQYQEARERAEEKKRLIVNSP
jgi:REP element-mobilizing transposase RayT